MPDIALRFNKDIVILEGAMGTMLMREGVDGSECAELVNVLDPELITNIHERYGQAGANAAITNSFGGSAHALAAYDLAHRAEELNRAAVRNARAASPEHVLADVGPCGLLMEPLGEATFDAVYRQYFDQVSALAAEGPDAILIETMTDIADARCALLAAKDACNLPVFVSCTFDATGHMEISGTTPEAAAIILEACGAAVVGMNCGLGPEQLAPLLERMGKATTLPLLVQPNAGIPYLDAHGKTVFPGTADELAYAANGFRAAGAQFIGSCCGSTPAFTGALYATLSGLDVLKREEPTFAKHTVITSGQQVVELGAGCDAVLIGERINPTGKPALAAELEVGQMSLVREMCEQQTANGAAIIDVNVGSPMVDETAVLPAAVLALSGFTKAPLSIDTTNPTALEAALKAYPGRALINSTAADPEVFERVMPLAKRYGAALVCLTLSESGIPKTVDGRMELVERLRHGAAAHGLRDSDLVFDVLTLTAASASDGPAVTLACVEAVSDLGLATMLGVSNVSHGLPERSLLNAAFTSAAIASGLSGAIANPSDAAMSEIFANHPRRVEQGAATAARDLWVATLKHALDVAANPPAAAGATDPKEQRGDVPTKSDAQQTLATTLERAVLRGEKETIGGLVDSLIAGGLAPQDVVEKILTPTLKNLGDAFGRGEAFLPQMMIAANSMKIAVARVRLHLPQGDAQESRGTVIFATVKGDVHSIGKDICVALLESQGFTVVDLGVDVEPAAILDASRKHQADAICLSALMTTTLTAMSDTVALIYREEPRFCDDEHKAVMVGGAVVSERWAQSVGAGYTADAASLVAHLLNTIRA